MYWNQYEPTPKVYWSLRLTLTWDVLKWTKDDEYVIRKKRLTLTWDVLKCDDVADEDKQAEGLTLTWDVLK